VTASENQAIANQGHCQPRAHDEQKCRIPGTCDIEEALDDRGISKKSMGWGFKSSETVLPAICSAG
jgi:hypothetical protein